MIRLLTFNCAAIPLLTPASGARLERLAAEVSRLEPDVVCLQELCLGSQARRLGRLLAAWPFRFLVPRAGLVAGGLAVFSKVPFREASFERFREQGPWLGYSCLARLSGKGFMRLVFDAPPLELFHTHLLADYSRCPGAGAPYGELQLKQLEQLLAALRGAGRERTMVLAGDLNFPPGSEPFRRLVEAGLEDPMEGVSEPSMVDEASFPTVPAVPRRMARLDYVLARSGSDPLVLTGARYVLDARRERGPGRAFTLSDHRGVLAEFEEGARTPGAPPGGPVG